MYLSNLLGPVKKPIFEILYRSGLRTAIQLEDSGIEAEGICHTFPPAGTCRKTQDRSGGKRKMFLPG